MHTPTPTGSGTGSSNSAAGKAEERSLEGGEIDLYYDILLYSIAKYLLIKLQHYLLIDLELYIYYIYCRHKKKLRRFHENRYR